MTPIAATTAALQASRRHRARAYRAGLAVFLAVLVAAFGLTLVSGQSTTPPADVLRVLLGEAVPGASFAVGSLRLPRAVLSVLAGFSFGLGGVVFQILLRNPLASPDIIGITSGASAAAVVAIVMLSLSGPAVSLLAIVSALMVALVIYLLAYRNGVAGTRLILVGIGVSAMADSLIAFVLSTAPSWTLQEAMRWLTGSVNGARLADAWPLVASLLLFGGLVAVCGRDLQVLRLGDDTAAALGVATERTRALLVVGAVGLIATATAVTGPIAFTAFLSGPIAARLVGNRGPLLLPAALVGAILVLLADWCGQVLLPGRYPVGVVTGALGAPYLVYLIVRLNRAGGSP